jgi:hypothetical protein
MSGDAFLPAGEAGVPECRAATHGLARFGTPARLSQSGGRLSEIFHEVDSRPDGLELGEVAGVSFEL